VEIEDPQKQQLFHHLLCQCGDCERLPLDSCICSWAEDARADLSTRLEAGATVEELITSYEAQHGAAAIAIPPDKGSGRALWAVPLALVFAAGIGVVVMGRRWRSRSVAGDVADAAARADAPPPGDDDTDYDALLDEELKRLEDE
jgi:cytochrome c-type biogenesis protein CcmH/NrfF